MLRLAGEQEGQKEQKWKLRAKLDPAIVILTIRDRVNEVNLGKEQEEQEGHEGQEEQEGQE